MEKTFTEIYETQLWGSNEKKEYSGSSGGGSTVNFNITSYIPFLQNFIKSNKVESVVDLGCGDFLCGEIIYNELNIKYTGYDVYKRLIDTHIQTYTTDKYQFKHLDFCGSPQDISGGDLCIIKDVLQHWKLSDIVRFMDNLTTSGKFKYIMIINCTGQTIDNPELPAGMWRALSSNFLPLKKYNPKQIFTYNTKEVCLIRC
jgi:hypothetical protein